MFGDGPQEDKASKPGPGRVQKEQGKKDKGKRVEGGNEILLDPG